MTRRRLRMLAVAVTAAFSLGLSAIYGTTVHANRGYSSTLDYYSDASLTEFVGQGYVDCDWHYTQLSGQQTSYYTSYNDPCGGASAWYGCQGGPRCPTDWSCAGDGVCLPPYCDQDWECGPNHVCVGGTCY
jgi:hypothetical protein